MSKAAASFSGANATNNTVKASIPQGWKLVPADGMVRCSTTSQWDSPWDHINLLRPCGGAQHTDKEANPNVIVELKNGVNLAGLVVTKRDGNENRMKKMEVSTSTDGATWFPLAATENMPKEWVITAPEGTKAKWIKVEAKNAQPEFMHLRHILVYENKFSINAMLHHINPVSGLLAAALFLSAPVQAALPAYSAVKDEAKTVNKYMIVVWAGTDWSPNHVKSPALWNTWPRTPRNPCSGVSRTSVRK